MAKPPSIPTWATDTNYASGPYTGTPTKTEPSGLKKARGWDPGERPGGQSFNWWWNLVGQWCSYLNDRFDTDGSLALESGADLVLSGDGDVKHGDRVLTVNSHGIMPGDANYIYTFTPAAWSSSGAGTSGYIAPQLRTGDRLKSITYAYRGNTGGNIVAECARVTGGATPADFSIGSQTLVAPAATWADSTLDVSDTTLASGETFVLVFGLSNSGLSIGNVRFLYDRP